MAGEEVNIDVLIWRMVRSRLKDAVRIGKAVKIDANKGVCDVELSKDVYLHNVKLKAVESGAGVGQIVEPKTDSYVVAAMIDGLEASWTLIQYTEIENWAVFCEKAKIELFNSNGGDEVHLNGKSKGGLVILQKLEANLNKLKDRLDAVETAVKAGLSGVGASPSASGAAGQTAFEGAMSAAQPVNFENMENDKVKHGDNS